MGGSAAQHYWVVGVMDGPANGAGKRMRALAVLGLNWQDRMDLECSSLCFYM